MRKIGSKRSSTVRVVKKMSDLHDELNDAIDKANECGSIQVRILNFFIHLSKPETANPLQMMLRVAVSFGEVVLGIFSMLGAFQRASAALLYSNSVFFLWSIYYFAYSLAIIYVGNITSEEVSDSPAPLFILTAL